MFPFTSDNTVNAGQQAPGKFERVLADLPPIEREHFKDTAQNTCQRIDDALQDLLAHSRPSIVRALIEDFQDLFTMLLAGSPADSIIPNTLDILRIRAGQADSCDEPFDAMQNAIESIRDHYRTNLGREPDWRDIRDMLDRITDPTDVRYTQRAMGSRRPRRRGNA